MSETQKKYVPLNEAAKIVGMRRTAFRDLMIAAGVTKKWGGTDEKPRLRVKMDDAERVIDRQLRYAPSALDLPERRRKKTTCPVSGLNPDVKC